VQQQNIHTCSTKQTATKPIAKRNYAAASNRFKMAKWFRSEPMEYISIIMNEDAAHDCLADLGKLGAIQFTDVSHAMPMNIRIPL
jgi:hypothetical protein